MWRALIWKECKAIWLQTVLSCAAIMFVGIVCLLLQTLAGLLKIRDIPIRDIPQFIVVMPAVVFAAYIYPVMLVATVFTRDRKKRIQGLVDALPVTPTAVFVIKLLVVVSALVMFVLAIMIACTFMAISHWSAIDFGFIGGGYLSGGSAILLYQAVFVLWLIAFACRATSETSVVLGGILILAASWLSAMSGLQESSFGLAGLLNMLNPFSVDCTQVLSLDYLRRFDYGEWLHGKWFAQGCGKLLVMLTLWSIGWLRYCWGWRFTGLWIPASPRGAEKRWLKPMGSPRRAAIWKEFRLGVPSLIVFGVVMLAPLAIMLGELWQGRFKFNEEVRGVFFAALQFGAYALALGMGTWPVCDEINPKLTAFWCARPLDVGTWYWGKYLTGLAMPLGIALVGPIVLMVAAAFTMNSDWILMVVFLLLASLTLVGIYSLAFVISLFVRNVAIAVVSTIFLAPFGCGLMYLPMLAAGSMEVP